MGNIKFFLVTIMSCTLIFACATSSNKAPNWLSGASETYPEPRYFIGIGSAPLDKGAQGQQINWAGNQARAEIAKILRAQVKSTTTAQREVMSGSEKPESSSTQTDIVTVTTDEVLQGVQIKSYYKDKKDGLVYALAVLDRPKSAKQLESKINNLKQEILVELEAAQGFQQEEEPLLAIKHFRRALNLAHNINAQSEIYAVLSPMAISQLDKGTQSAADIQKILYGLGKQVKFQIQIQGPADGVKPYIIKGLAQAGFITKGSEATSKYILSGKTDLNYKGNMKMGDFFVQIYQADLDLEVINAETEEIIGALTWSASGNEKTASMASKSAVRALGRLVEGNIAEKILDIF
ncbi:MAG: LPP20 family lipoprotein [Pseudomonadota bacterium]